MPHHASDDCADSHFEHQGAQPMGHIRNMVALTVGRLGDTPAVCATLRYSFRGPTHGAASSHTALCG